MILNGYPNTQMHAFTYSSGLTMVDYAISNQAALPLIGYLDIADHPPYAASKSYHVHLVIGLHVGTPSAPNHKNGVAYAPCLW